MNRLSEKLHDQFKKMLPRYEEPLLKRLIVWLLLLIIAGVLGSFFLFTLGIAVLSIGLPDVRDFNKLAGVESTVIYDRDGGILYSIHGEENRQYVPLEAISINLQRATIAIEDDQFYEHIGFDIPGITAGVLYEIFGIGRPRGGSTITQQLAKNAFLTAKRSYLRKMKELILAIRLERAYDKDKILELYLNRIPYGNNAYGAELASQIYFDKPAEKLTLAEAAILASLPKAPSFFSPFGPNVFSSLNTDFELDEDDFPQTVEDLDRNDYTIGLIGREISFSKKETLYVPGRADLVLKRMEDLDMVSEGDRRKALADLRKIDFQRHRISIRAPHFVFYIRQQLEEQFGKEIVEQGGLQVYTTIDSKLQEKAEVAVQGGIETKREAHGVSNGALLSIDPQTGQILAMVGSANYFSEEDNGNVNHVFARRQPGSSIKPIIYAKVFLNRYSPATVIYDTPTNFGAGYRPSNYDGTFKGPMTIRYALGQSRNIPALKAYFLAGQQEEIVPFARKVGLESLNPNGNFGPPLAIGAAETTLMEMVTAYSVFANEGRKRDIYGLIKVVDREGDVIFERFPDEKAPEEVIDPQVAYLINSILSDSTINIGPRMNIPNFIVAAKTGTSNKEITPTKILPNNGWIIGYTKHIVTGVWIGNSDGTPMKLQADGYNTAAPIWQEVMIFAHEGKENIPFAKPKEIKTVSISRASGLLPSSATPKDAILDQEFASFAIPTEQDSLYVRTVVNTLDGLLPTAETPAEYLEERPFINHKDPIDTFPSWLVGIKEWVKGTRIKDPTFLDFPPEKTTPLFTAETLKNRPTIRILSPTIFSSVSSFKVPVEVEVTAPHGVDRVLFLRDDRKLPYTTERKAPYTGFIRFGTKAEEGRHLIRARVYDTIGFFDEAVIEVNFMKPTEVPEVSENGPDNDEE